MLWMAYILTTPRSVVASLYTGYAISVQRVSCTGTECVLTIAQKIQTKVAHIVLAKKFVIATPWQPAARPLQQSGTLRRTTHHQLM